MNHARGILFYGSYLSRPCADSKHSMEICLGIHSISMPFGGDAKLTWSFWGSSCYVAGGVCSSSFVGFFSRITGDSSLIDVPRVCSIFPRVPHCLTHMILNLDKQIILLLGRVQILLDDLALVFDALSFPLNCAIILSFPRVTQDQRRYHPFRLHEIKLVSKVSAIKKNR